MNSSKSMTTSAILVALAVVFSLALYFIPFIQFALFIIGLPIIVIGKVSGIKMQVLGSIAIILILLFFDPIYAMIVGLVVLPLSLVQGYLLKKEFKSSYVICIGAVVMVFGFLGVLYGLNFIFDIDFMADLELTVDTTIDQMRLLYSNVGLEKAELQTMYAVLEQTRIAVVLLLPSMLILYAMITSVLSFVLSKHVLKRLGYPIKSALFRDFRIDKQGRLILMIVLGMIILMTFVDPANATFYVSNFMSIFGLILQINALAFIWFLLEKHPKKQSMKVGIIILFILGPIIPGLIIIRYILSMLGFADLYVDFRAKINSKSE